MTREQLHAALAGLASVIDGLSPELLALIRDVGDDPRLSMDVADGDASTIDAIGQVRVNMAGLDKGLEMLAQELLRRRTRINVAIGTVADGLN
ncbi:MAG TPA: hypothetical protein VH475_08220 [Tepidisphaeraceae bacterium]